MERLGVAPWWLLEHWPHQGVQALIRDLNRLYRETPALHVRDCEPEGFRWIVVNDDTQSVLAFLRRGAPSDPPVAVVCNFTPEPRVGYRLGLPYEDSGAKRSTATRVPMAAPIWAISAASPLKRAPRTGFPASATLTLPPLSTLFLVFSPPAAEKAAS